MGKKKIIIDTNNLISSIGWEGDSRKLINDVIEQKYEWFISYKQLTELKRVMSYQKLKFTELQKNKFLDILSEVANIVETNTTITLCKDPDDNMLLECALEVRADYIISGDNDLKELKNYKNTKIISVKDFLNKIT